MKKVTLSHIELNQLEVELVQYFNMHLLNDTTAMNGIEETFKRLRQKME